MNNNAYKKWKIGNVVRGILLADTAITQYVGTNIFPLVAPEKTDGNFIVYAREKYSKLWAKPIVYEDDCQLFLTVVSDNYDVALDIAEKIDDALTGYHTLDNDVRIKIDIKDSSEIFEDNKYFETILLKIE